MIYSIVSGKMDVLTQILFRSINNLFPNGRFKSKSPIFLCEIEPITGLALRLLYLSLLLNDTLSKSNDIRYIK
jgi:hypothetical protein